MKIMTRKTWLWGVSTLIVVFLAIQLVHPDWGKIIKPETMQRSAEIQAPEDVKAILRNSCFDCHSDETRLSWFDKITPANFLVATHLEKGKAALNFSEWNKLTPPQQKAELFYSLNKILEKEMPLASYAMIHPEAKLTKENIDILKRYVTGITTRKTTSTGEVAASDDQFRKWQQPEQEGKTKVQPASNGIQYIDGYRSWKAMSTTDRFDNGTMRVIFVNVVGENAISNRKTNPWPDGTVFAKVAWKEKTDNLGNITPGEFFQVEFMIKDQKKYAGTKGWGWARWRGADLKPYGKDASFTNECVSCHAPLKDNDYVFTYPLNLQSDK